MDTKLISMVSAAALLALTGTASAGPMSIASSEAITPPLQIEQIHYRYHRHRHHYRHYGWHRGWHYAPRYRYGWRHRYYRYGYRYPGYYGYNPVGAAAGAAVGLATLPFAMLGAAPYYRYPYYGYRPYYYY